MLASTLGKKLGLVMAMVLLVPANLAVTPAAAEVGVPPSIAAILGSDTDIDPGETRTVVAVVYGFDEGGSFEFSGDGLEVASYRERNGRYRISVSAAAVLAAGPRDLIATNPDGLAGSYVGALTVTGDVPPPDGGSVTGSVFGDIDGDGSHNGFEVGLEGVAVSVTDSEGTGFTASTDGSGDYTIAGVAPGIATVTYSTPVEHTLTTGNAVQTVTVVDEGLVAAAEVGYLGPSIGDVSGYVFSDFDGNGIEDGNDGALRFVAITITDVNGTVFTPTTDATGYYFQPGVATGDATVVFTTPAGYTLTTSNDTQTVTSEYRLVKYSAAVGFAPPLGNTPEITGIRGNNEISQGQTMNFRVSVVNFVSGATFAVSGDGVTAVVVAERNGTARVSISATATASVGPRDLILTNPDGLSSTLEDAIIVNAS